MEQNVGFTFGKGVTNLYRTLKRTRPDILIPSTDNDDDYTDYGFNYSPIIELEDTDVVEGSVSNQPAPLEQTVYLEISLQFDLFIKGSTIFQSNQLNELNEEDKLWQLQPLYPNSNWTTEEFFNVLELIKTMGHLSELNESLILGLVASILSANNVLAAELRNTSQSNYFFQKTIKSSSTMKNKCRIYTIPACFKGCCAFIGPLEEALVCPICNNPNSKEINETIYYFPIIDRIKKIISSDLKKFLFYSNNRKTASPLFLEDVYDGEEWKWFNNQMRPGEIFIGLQFCWDGVDMFNFSGKSAWPLVISILNFPKDLRDKLNVGLHLVALCSGN